MNVKRFTKQVSQLPPDLQAPLMFTGFIRLAQRNVVSKEALAGTENTGGWDESKLLIFFYLLKAYSPVNCTGSPQGFFTSSNLAQVEYN